MNASARRSRGEQAGLTREAVVAAAEAVAERTGLAGLSLRAVATELGVSATAIYHHVRDRDELLDAVADAFVAREVLQQLPDGDGPLERIRLIGHRLFSAGVEHPGLLTSIIGYLPEQSPSAQLDCAQIMLADLQEAGATPERAVVLYRAILTLCVGEAIAYANHHRPRATSVTERFERHASVEKYALLGTYLRNAVAPDWDRSFGQQLDLVLRELEPDTAKPGR
ncbi:Tetracycline repressor protein class H [Streptomyces sp. YIM 130001]|uniref:TetR/AcrR family transcriptional regulator n=1 Tax=Streptomyces sp. YIM 130001 TaxID=2259644 RepID=UPI000EBEF739|nr:TetR/AcrR family transcriptional regulator [Streptomyces sp. YIM 130001]RII14825.1 Tetracycline repressor protein class H [Streptomyces sp. YIM 130001]